MIEIQIQFLRNLKYPLMDLIVLCTSYYLFSTSMKNFGLAEEHLASCRITVSTAMLVHKLALTVFHPIPVDLIRLLLLQYFVSQLED